MNTASPYAAIALCVLLLPATGRAETSVWEMACSEDQVNNSGVGDGSTDSTATGSAVLRHDSLTSRLSYDIAWGGLEGLLSAIHIHGPAIPAASNMAHLFNVYTGEPDVITAGVDRTTDSVYDFEELGTLIFESGGAHTEANALAFMVDEMAYVNIHSTLWPTGEIRCHMVLTQTIADGTEQSKDQQKCINALRKGMRKVALAQAKHLTACVQEAGKSGPAGSEVCAAGDTGGKVAKAAQKTTDAFAKFCMGGGVPDFGSTDATTVNAAAVDGGLDLAHDAFGNDLDTGLAGPGDVARCQKAVFSTLRKCQDARIKDYDSCTKSDLPGKVGLTIVDEYGMGKCLGSDRKGKVARSCNRIDGKLRAIIDKKCASVDLAAAFPGCSQALPEDTAACLDRAASCRVCLAASTADAIAPACDLLDDGLSNASCVP